MLLLATVAIALLKAPEEPTRELVHPPDEIFRVSFEEIRAGKAKCIFRYDESLGAEFITRVWGSERARVAMDKSKYWFWIGDYDKKRHYECLVEIVEKTDLMPPLRPSFLVWILNDLKNKDSFDFMDGEYKVELKTSEGSIIEQKYTREGVVEAKVTVLAFQESSGRKFPALAMLEINGESIKIDMGVVETANPASPNTNPPSWSSPKVIEF